MSQTPGTRLGPYEITGKLGAGGMGEVYRATDTNLKRQVAIKVLPESLAGDADRLMRFQREAEVLAALNHPNIAQIYGLERTAGTTALVMELVEGRDLSEVLAGGAEAHALHITEALAIARQIIDALEAAHEQGIVHRDLKPANIKVREDGTVKVLDFGLAKAMEPDGAGSSADVANSPTLTARATQLGMILGTASYMSPEQARGRPVDRRTDVWAFGCVLFEMLTGRKAFHGEDVTEIISAVVKTEPEWSALPAGLPAAVRTVVTRCLVKDRKARIPDLSVVRYLLDGTVAAEGGVDDAPPATQRSVRLWQAVSAVLVLMTVVAGAAWYGTRAAGPPLNSQPISFSLTLPDGFSLANTPPAISPDGTQIAFVVSSADRVDQLWVRRLGDVAPRPLDGTTGASAPFWAPDSRYIGYFSGSTLWTVDSTGAPPRRVAALPGDGRGGAWNEAGDILFGVTLGPVASNPGLFRVPAAGGIPIELTRVEGAGRTHRWPQFLPDGRRFLFLRQPVGGGSEIAVAALDDPTPRRVVEADGGRYVDPGYLLFLRDGTLLGQALDARTAQLTGEPFVVQSEVAEDRSARAVLFDVAPGGVLVFRAGLNEQSETVLKWFGRDGGETDVGLPAGGYEAPVLSRDGDRLAVHRSRLDDITVSDIWVFDLDSRLSTRLTTNEAGGSVPVWSPEGDRLVFAAGGGGPRDLFIISSTSPNTGELLFTNPNFKTPTDWSRDGAFILFNDTEDVYALPVAGDRVPVPVTTTPDASEGGGHFSPDGHWVAYHSDTSGANRIYVSPFPPTGQVIPVSAGEGTWPQWRDDGREIYYLSPDDQIMAVPIRYENGVPRAGAAVELFDTEIAGPQPRRNYYAATGDGQRFLIPRPVGDGPVRRQSPLTVIVNWLAQVGR